MPAALEESSLERPGRANGMGEDQSDASSPASDDDGDDDALWPRPLASRLDAPLIQVIHGAYHALHQRLAAETRVHGTQASEALVLVDLHRNFDSTSIEIAFRLGFHRSTLSSVLARLEGDGLVVRERSPYDGRRYGARLTRAGIARARILAAVLAEIEEELDDFVSTGQHRAAVAAFEACRALYGFEAADFD
jgi:DNA-binding MarR family transcriptional regulator